MVKHFGLSRLHRPGAGWTPLHVASCMGRQVDLLVLMVDG